MSDDRELGGESACWAHFLDELDRSSAPSVEDDAGDLAEVIDGGADGAVWSLPHGGDLDANIVRIGAGRSIAKHVNDEVDVLIVVWRGYGSVEAADRTIELRPGVVVNIARGARRSIVAGSADLVYLTVHRRRDGLHITSRS